MKSATIAVMLFASLSAAATSDFRYWCLKSGDTIPRDEANCSAANNRACQNSGCARACFPNALAIQVYRVSPKDKGVVLRDKNRELTGGCIA
ncbi:hypothetical protein PTMSG1_10173 [Pyrenophora teres f. maculata]|nr:hypothetical protein PTMSG1_10173 [Pyrenophora teres f. maculata]